MGARSFDIAVEVVADGWCGDEAVAEWMARVEQEGERYCPLAYEQILATSCEPEAPVESDVIEDPDAPYVFDPLFDGEFIYGDVPGEPDELVFEVTIEREFPFVEEDQALGFIGEEVGL